MLDIYEQHKAAFARVAAYVVTRKGERQRVATIAFKYPADGAGRLYAYVHWLGTPMARGSATGGGYDKATAACASAVAHWRKTLGRDDAEVCIRNHADAHLSGFLHALAQDRGPTWDNALRDAGFTVWQAV